MKFLIEAKITTVEWCRNPVEIEAENEKAALEKANEILEDDPDQFYGQKLDIAENDIELSIEGTKSATFKQCPYCFADGIESINNMEKPENRVLQTMKCSFCEKKWVDIYTLSSRENGDAETIQLF